MKQEIESFDSFYINKILIQNKSPKVIIWFIFMSLFSCVIILLISLYKYPKYDTYQGFVNKEGENFVIETFIQIDSVNLHNIKNFIYKNRNIDIDKVEYSHDTIESDDIEYLQVKFYTSHTFLENSYIQFKVFKEDTTLLKELIFRIRKDLNL